MEIQGIQKMTLLDYPGKVSATVFLGGCNMRCPFCHNGNIVTGQMESVMTDDELLAFLSRRVGLLDGVCITGGEPTLRSGLPALIRKIKDLGFLVKLDTNGTNFEMLKELIDDNLVDYVAMDIKNMPYWYRETAGLSQDFDLDPIIKSASLLMEDRVDYEFRTTVVDNYHCAHSFHIIGKWLSGAKRYYLQQFVERDTCIKKGLKPPTKEVLEMYTSILRTYIPDTSIRGI